ncbi:MAG: response regulator, partial [bacterium]|nr:response regulator [bacterium]
MTNQIVLVADEDIKNLQILKENLEASGFLVITAPNGNKAWEEIQRTPPKLILTEVNLSGLNGYQLLERLHADPNTASLPLIFLTNQREIQQRVRAFELGAKDYLIKPLHVKEVIAHIRMVLRRLERRKAEQLETYMKFSGRLDQLSLADLIESFGVERKTGILTISNGRRTGHVYFRDGAVVNASMGDFKQETAAYQMFPWRKGYFNMVFREIDVADEISTSNLGLLLQGIKRTELREKLISQLSSPKTAFTITPTFKLLMEKKKVSGDATNFIDLLDGQRDVEQIIDDSGLDDLTALTRIVRLYQQGFIKPTIPPAKKPVLPGKIEPKEDKRIDIPQIPETYEEDFLDASPVIKSATADDEFFEETAIEKKDELEQEIKPIFERIEKERQKLIVPEEEEIVSVKPDEDLASELFEEEAEQPASFASITKEEDDLSMFSDQIFVDEELIRQQFDEDGEGDQEDAATEEARLILMPETVEQ